MALVSAKSGSTPQQIEAILDGVIYRLAVATTDNEFSTKVDLVVEGTLTLVAGGGPTVIATATIGALKSGRLTNIAYGGSRGGKFYIKINGTIKYRPRINGPDSKFIPFDRFKLAAGDTVSVEVENDGVKTGDYETSITYHEV